MNFRTVFVSLLAFAMIPSAHAAVDVESFTKKNDFVDIKISPDGTYYAATTVLDDSTALAIVRRSDNKITGTMRLGKNNHVDDFWWVNNERLLASTAQKFGNLDEPQPTGNIYAVNADGGNAEILVGQGVNVISAGTKIKAKESEAVAAFLIDDLPNDEKNVLISVQPFTADPYTRVERMDVYSGRRVPVTRAPVRNARFMTDNAGNVRFAMGVGLDNVNKLYYRSATSDGWTLVNDEMVSRRVEWPLGFSADDKTAYLQSENIKGPDSIIAMDVASGSRKDLLRNATVDPYRIIYKPGTATPIGAIYMDGKPSAAFFDAASPEAKLQRGLELAFSDGYPYITSTTADGRYGLIVVYGDKNPGDFYVFDIVDKKAAHLTSNGAWLDTDVLAEMKPVSLTSRDGLALHGYLTVPHGSSGKNLPTVILPHGGPFGINDKWLYSNEAQLLAAAGYAVLQVNYRGSGSYGRDFQQAGAREWGGKMQDDLTDATRWSIQQGIADPQRICIYGASYGAYASLMGVAKEPGLYKCAAGYVGVYDLPMMQSADSRYGKRLGNWSKDWVGKIEELETVSPNRIADRIKVPVFLAAGGEDETAPIEHSYKMEQALKKAGVPVETLYFDTEGHGFYTDAHRREFYTKLLAFLSSNIGGATAKPAASIK